MSKAASEVRRALLDRDYRYRSDLPSRRASSYAGLMLVTYVLTADRKLGDALIQRFNELDGVSARRFDADVQPGFRRVVVTPVADCPEGRCAELTTRGFRVIVLAPVARASEETQYLRAGAIAYLPMMVDGAALVDTLREALSSG